MIGLILIYFIGNAFYKLSVEHNKNKWLFAILGIVAYYASGVALGFGMAIAFEFGAEVSFENMSPMALALMEVPVGMACCYGFYRFLKFQWSKPLKPADQILDSDLMK